MFLFCFKLRASLSALSSPLYLVDIPIVLVRDQRLQNLIDQLKGTFGEGMSEGMKAVLSQGLAPTFCPDPN